MVLGQTVREHGFRGTIDPPHLPGQIDWAKVSGSVMNARPVLMPQPSSCTWDTSLSFRSPHQDRGPIHPFNHDVLAPLSPTPLHSLKPTLERGYQL